MENKEITKYAGIYNEFAELLGDEATEKIYHNMSGQQITLPRKLYTQEYVVENTKRITDQMELKKEALKYGYSERRLKQLLKKEREKSETK